MNTPRPTFVIKNRRNEFLADFALTHDTSRIWTLEQIEAAVYTDLSTVIQIQQRFPSDCFVEVLGVG